MGIYLWDTPSIFCYLIVVKFGMMLLSTTHVCAESPKHEVFLCPVLLFHKCSNMAEFVCGCFYDGGSIRTVPRLVLEHIVVKCWLFISRFGPCWEHLSLECHGRRFLDGCVQRHVWMVIVVPFHESGNEILLYVRRVSWTWTIWRSSHILKQMQLTLQLSVYMFQHVVGLRVSNSAQYAKILSVFQTGTCPCPFF